MQPWLSVIVPTYNGAAYLGQALASIEAQGDDQIEILAIDDGSSDATLSILEARASHLPLRIVKKSHGGNWVASTNHGLAQARGRYACFLHQDDLWLPQRLRVLRGLVARHPSAPLVLHPAHYIDARGNWVGVWRSPLAGGLQAADRVIERLLVQNFIAVPAPIFDRQAALRVGGLDETLWYTADWDFWLKMARVGPAVYHPRPLAAFRIHAASQTAQGVARAGEMRRQIEVVLHRHLEQWLKAHPGCRDIRQAAHLSLEVNHALAACAYGVRPNWKSLSRSVLGMRPAGWYRFFRDSRIVERIFARLSARLVYRRGERPAPIPRSRTPAWERE